MNRAAAGVLVLATLWAFSGCSGSEDDEGARPDRPASSQPEGCTEASAKATERSQISASGIEPSCVKVSKGGSFTLVNADAKAHDFTTSEDSPVQLQVDLKRGAAFPYTFKKAGTYTFAEAESDFAVTVIVN